MQDIPEPIAPDVRPFRKTDQGFNPPSHTCLSRIILHDGEYHAIDGKVRSGVGSAEEALVEIQGTE